ncbi:SIR2 family protein [Paenibacillus favisporus]|uniref:SIR2 family protein n=1 Tax=Paenibacillus favisporus TaxID=221028 RepID=UPI0013D82702|nr:SIR2 family protein [Paenibacillus favisporus]
MTKYLFLFGNGFTIDFLSHMGIQSDVIDVLNLFAHGDTVKYPKDKVPGFLSYTYCKNLWNLGARPNMSYEASMELIEALVTCANTASAVHRKFDTVYLQAYQELTTYLKYLFVEYNNKVTDDEINTKIHSWGWAVLLKGLVASQDTSKITIITYNYDIWLERVLMACGINFEVVGVKNGKYRAGEEAKVQIIKPHGSISFAYRDPIASSQFVLTSAQRDEIVVGNASDYTAIYDSLESIYVYNAMIPPAGDSLRIDSSDPVNDNWARLMRREAIKAARDLHYVDEMYICGISYWHVDRIEFDQILTSVPPAIKLKVVNPKPSSTFNAVLTGLFEEHITYNNSKVLGGILK